MADLVRLSFVLHRLSDPEAALREAARVAPRVLITDWKLPERNLDYLLYLPLLVYVRCLHSRERWESFRRFMLQGGAEGLIRNMGQSRDAGARLFIVKRSFLRFGSVVRLEAEACR
jgi:ubiquinone/menaquinone biosynthesis C-methylase UbiE